jgi:hypothetical protein
MALRPNSPDSAKACYDVAQILGSYSQCCDLTTELYKLSDSQGYLPATQKLIDREPHNEPLEIPFFDVFANGNSDY